MLTREITKILSVKSGTRKGYLLSLLLFNILLDVLANTNIPMK